MGTIAIKTFPKRAKLRNNEFMTYCTEVRNFIEEAGAGAGALDCEKRFTPYVAALEAYGDAIVVVTASELTAKLAEAEARKAELDNIASFAEEWKALYEQRDKRVDELNVKIDQLYQDKETDRQRIRELQEKNTQLTLDLQAANFKKCEKKGCGDRQPPTGY